MTAVATMVSYALLEVTAYMERTVWVHSLSETTSLAKDQILPHALLETAHRSESWTEGPD